MNIMSYDAIYDIFLKITRVAHRHIGQEKMQNAQLNNTIFAGENIR